ncbi:hypothetical protein [Halomontanus rarus]|uniref:hypothetical protein n=1 Tax=Halomontanus rarus TaxID=3034020 RepID=UPI0023E7A1C5|nr:hypothetical protein [Halovivax sp. TS33]
MSDRDRSDSGADSGTDSSQDSDPDPSSDSDSDARPRALPECPSCGDPMIATTSTGPTTHYASPCGCRIARGDLDLDVERR